MRILSWNVAGKLDIEDWLDGFDVAMLQETRSTEKIPHGPGPTAVRSLHDGVRLRPISMVDITTGAASPDEIPLSYPGTIAAAEVLDGAGVAQLILVSVYVKWEKTGSWVVPDASAHRLVSDLSALINTERHRLPIIVAGDWNIFFQSGETPYWLGRYQSVFDRMRALGFEWLGPTAGLHRPPRISRSVVAWPESATPTYRTTRETVETAWRQLDHVFASRRIAKHVQVEALNDPAEWGPSDHCRIQIQYDPDA